MTTGIKIKAPIPLTLSSMGLPHVHIHIESEYVEAIFSPEPGSKTQVEVQCSSAPAEKKRDLKQQIEAEFQCSGFKLNLLWTQMSAPPFSLERRMLHHLLLVAKDFYERKGQSFSYEPEGDVAYDPLFLNGKFTYERYDATGSFPFPRGWSYGLVKGPFDFEDLPASDQQAAILSEALYKNNPFLLHEMKSPIDMKALWGEVAEQALIAVPLQAVGKVLVIFGQSYKRDSFQKNLQKPYHCTPTALDTLGTRIV